MTNIDPNLTNRNKFKFEIYFSDVEHFEFFAKSFTFGGITIGTINVPTPIRSLEYPGSMINMEDVVVDFYLDEEWKTYREIFKWMKRIKNTKNINQEYLFANAKIVILNTKFREVFNIKLIDIFPYSLTTITLDNEDDGMPVIGQIVFKTNDMEIE